MNYTQPIIRIILRYGVGGLFTYQVGSLLAADPDLVDLIEVVATAAVGAATEWWYARAKKNGGAT